ncbi:hypothetical protein PBY51_015615 [Eleginops maclovinus]|uniref:Uncharacterized protein n=1 Tax=Eleginops maclovinus TaxID=56733 RepID=A0AAN7XP11_ELEMC|nr:hypothetical protein PBY51_015615 [Eleginops maclovinus]
MTNNGFFFHGGEVEAERPAAALTAANKLDLDGYLQMHSRRNNGRCPQKHDPHFTLPRKRSHTRSCSKG